MTKSSRFFAPFLWVTVAAAVPAGAHAQIPDTLPEAVLEQLVVSARRYPVLRTEIPQKIEIITRADIERSGERELVDVLKKQAAVDVIQYPGLLSGIGIRGFRPEFSGINKHTLLLIDGRPAGAANLATIDLNAIERIEVLKGPASSLYGSSAMGGAVNLITRTSRGPLRGSASAAYGSWETADLNTHLGGNLSDRVDTDLGFSWFRRNEDFRVGEGNALRDLVGSDRAVKIFGDTLRQRVADRGDGEVRPNTEYGYRTGSARLGFRFTPALRADVRGEVFQADDVETPGDIFVEGDAGGRKNLGRRTVDLGVRGEMGRHAPLLRVFAADEETEFFDTGVENPFINFVGASRTYGGQLQDVVRFGRQVVTAGVDYTAAVAESERSDSAGAPIGTFSPNSAIRSAAVFAEGRWSLLGDRLIGTLGGRLDRIDLELRETPLRADVRPETEKFTSFNPSVGLQYALAPGLRVHGTAGRAFVAPDAFNRAGLSQRVSAAGVASITIGNAALDPEHSLTYDVGVGYVRPTWGLDADVTWFRTRVDDRITRVRAAFPATGRPLTAAGIPVGSVTTYVNAAEAEMQGLEWRLGYDLGALAGRPYSLRLFANATHLFRADEVATAASVDAARFAGRTDFRPEEVSDALLFGAQTPSQIRNVADLTLGYGIEWDDLQRWSLRLGGRYVGERTDIDFTDFANVSDIEYPAFMTLDLVAGARLGRGLRTDLIVDNLTDENYYEKRGFNLPGRSIRLRISADL